MQKVQGWSESGGASVVITGTPGSGVQRFQQSFKSSTITVYLAGTVTLASIYADTSRTVKANPFTANTSTGAWDFYADGGRYDIKFSGGGISAPFTLGDTYIPVDADVTQFGVKADGVTDDSAAVQRGITALQNLGGGILEFPDGTYLVSNLSITRSGITLRGASSAGTILKITSGAASSYCLSVDLTGGQARPLPFRMENFTIQGDSASLRTYNGIQLYNVSMPYLNNIRFTALNKCVTGRGCFYGLFASFWFDNYSVGIEGYSGSFAMNANTFIGMQFIEGNTDGNAKPIDGDFLGNNTFMQAVFGSSISLGNGTIESGTSTTFINPRLETITSSDHWMTISSKCRIVNPEVSSQVSQATGKYIFDITGSENRIECRLSGSNIFRVVRLESGAFKNIIEIDPVLPTGSFQPILDLGLNNRIDIGSSDHLEGDDTNASAASWSDRSVSNLITRSIDQAGFTMDGLTKTLDNSIAGPTGRGGVYRIDTPTGNRQMTQSVGVFGVNSCFGMSFWAMAVSGGEQTIQACLSESPSGDYNDVTITSTRWSRVLLLQKFTAGSFARLFSIRLPVAHPGIYLYGPQVVNLGADAVSGEVSPAYFGGYVPTYAAVRTDPQPHDPWRFQKAAPTGGTWYRGDRVFDLTCSASGVAPGLVCITDGSPGTWVAEAVLGLPLVVDGGVFTPTLTNTLNVGASTANQSMYYRVGNLVTVTGSATITPTAAAPTTTQLDIDLPIASNIASTVDVNGLMTATAVPAENGSILGVVATDRARLQFQAASLGARQCWFTFTYVVK